MEYFEFCNNVKNILSKMVDDKCNVRVEEVIKNNQVSLQAVVIMENGRNSAPSIFLEKYYGEYLSGRNLNDICLDIMVINDKYKDAISFDINDFLTYEKVKDKIYVKVINKNKNRKRLEKMPWIEFLDLAAIAYVETDEFGCVAGTINVTDANMTAWNIDKETLFDAAIKNTVTYMKPCLEKIGELMKELYCEKIGNNSLYGMDELDQIMNAIDTSYDRMIYVLTNKKRINGSVYIMFNDILISVAEEINDNLYIIPSSIHELIIVPEKCAINENELKYMVKEINKTELDPKEVLSDSIYYFDRSIGNVQIK